MLVFLRFDLEHFGLESSGRSVGRIPTKWQLSKLSWCRVLTKNTQNNEHVVNEYWISSLEPPPMKFHKCQMFRVDRIRAGPRVSASSESCVLVWIFYYRGPTADGKTNQDRGRGPTMCVRWLWSQFLGAPLSSGMKVWRRMRPSRRVVLLVHHVRWIHSNFSSRGVDSRDFFTFRHSNRSPLAWIWVNSRGNCSYKPPEVFKTLQTNQGNQTVRGQYVEIRRKKSQLLASEHTRWIVHPLPLQFTTFPSPTSPSPRRGRGWVMWGWARQIVHQIG